MMDKLPERKISRDPVEDAKQLDIYRDKVAYIISSNPMSSKIPVKYKPGLEIMLDNRSDQQLAKDKETNTTDLTMFVKGRVEQAQVGIYLCTYIDETGLIHSMVCTEDSLAPIV